MVAMAFASIYLGRSVGNDHYFFSDPDHLGHLEIKLITL